MESREDMEAFFHQQEESLAQLINRHENFIKELEEELLILPFAQFPQIGKHSKRFIKALIKEAHSYTRCINERIEYHLYPLSDYTDENLLNFKVRQREEEARIEAEIAEVVKAANGDQEYIEEMTELIKASHEETEFTFLCHDKVKEVITKHFPELVEFSGNAIRDINCVSYACMSEYKDAFYYLTINYR